MCTCQWQVSGFFVKPSHIHKWSIFLRSSTLGFFFCFLSLPRLVMQKLSDVQAKKTRLGSEWCLFTISEAFECMCVFRVWNGLNNSAWQWWWQLPFFPKEALLIPFFQTTVGTLASSFSTLEVRMEAWLYSARFNWTWRRLFYYSSYDIDLSWQRCLSRPRNKGPFLWGFVICIDASSFLCWEASKK